MRPVSTHLPPARFSTRIPGNQFPVLRGRHLCLAHVDAPDQGEAQAQILGEDGEMVKGEILMRMRIHQ
jgi:hypothetical protein